VLHLRQAPDLLPPRPRPLEQPPLLRVMCFFLSTERAFFVYFMIRSNVSSTTSSRGFFLLPRSVVFVFAQVCSQIRSTPSLSRYTFDCEGLGLHRWSFARVRSCSIRFSSSRILSFVLLTGYTVISHI
jgi:hypothetical protein